jgi:5'-nucleotidase
MHLLLTNDDGIYAEGLQVLYRCLASEHTVSVVAPDRERSAVSHGLTLHHPLRVIRIALNGDRAGYAVNGTPADCVKLALNMLLDTPPDMVIAGINTGANVGVDINYSGTVAAAKEAALFGLPAIAVSVAGPGALARDDAAAFVVRLAAKIHASGLPRGTFLNVNFPDLPHQAIAGVRISPHGVKILGEYFDRRVDLRNRPYYWQGCDPDNGRDQPEVDAMALRESYVTITPIRCDMTDYRALEDLRRWGIALDPEPQQDPGDGT